ncbi:Ig-like domain-containing protein, partial [Candidatus Peregrinibacteria bacterium]|nr:Ig-like domain-containing protein [Candidatus Peregrinibacteria bacterium]
MLEPRKKIRQLMSELEASLNKQKASKEIDELVQAIEKTSPHKAHSVFQSKLKNNLLAQHKTMAKDKHKTEKKFSIWSDFRMKGMAVAFAALVLVVLAGVISYPFLPAPTVMGYELRNSIRKISYNAPIKITFNQLMSNSSVEENLKFEPALPGKISWQGNTLVYTPDQEFKIGDKYQVTVGVGAKSLLQKPLVSEYSEYYEIVDAPKVALITPAAGQSGIATDSEINIMFDRSVSGLTTLEEAEKNIPHIRIEPSASGRWKWIGTSAIQFIPDKLKLATSYKITVPKGTVVLDGGSTTEEFSTTFETIRPYPEMIENNHGTDTGEAASKSEFYLTFNQKIDLGSANQLIQMKGPEALVPLDIRYFNQDDWKAKMAQESEMVEMSTYEEIAEVPTDKMTAVIPPVEMPTPEIMQRTLVIIPKQELTENVTYSLNVMEGLKGAEGDLGVMEAVSYPIAISGKLNLEVSDQNFDYTELGIPEFTFNNQIDLRSLRGKVKISPEQYDEDNKVIAPTIVTNGKGFMVNYPYRPAIEYKINIDGGIKDIYGHVYDKPIEFKFLTADYKPALALESGTDINILDGYKPTLFYIKSTNIDSAKVQLKALDQKEFLAYYGRGWVQYDMVNVADDAFSFTGELPITLEKNKRGHTTLDLDKLTGNKLASGFYMMQVSNPNVTEERCEWIEEKSVCRKVPRISKSLFVVSKSALAMKFNNNQQMIWATDLASGKPIDGMTVQAVGDYGKTTEAITDINGVAKLSNDNSESLIIATRDGDVSVVHGSWVEGVAPWDFHIDTEYMAPEYYLYLYTERPIYRPGQEVAFKGIVRQEKNYKFQLPEIQKVKVVVNDSMGNEVYNKELSLSKNGTFNDSLQLGAAVATGDYSISAELVQPKDVYAYATNMWANFKVYEYRKPEYKLDMTPDQKDYISGQTAKVKVEAGYFFGAPLKDAEIRWTLKSQDYYFILPEELAAKVSGWFSFAEEGYFCYWRCTGDQSVVSQGTVKADANGVAEISLPLVLGDKKMSQIYTLEAVVSDANNQSVANRISFPVHQGEFYLGVRSQDYVLETGKAGKFEAISVTTDGKILANKGFEAAIYRREWNTVKRKNVDGGFYYENTYEDKLVEKKNVSTDADGKAGFEFQLGSGGSYKVEISAKDSRGNRVISSTSVYVSGGDFINWGSENNDRIELVNDKMEYKVGETAKILVKSPYKNVYALVTYEKDKVMEYKVVKLESNSDTIEVPITEKFLPNVFVSVVLVKGSEYDAGLVEPVAGAIDERQVAAFKVGYTTLQVNTEEKRLNIEIKSNKEKYAPGEEVTLTVKTTDNSGKAVPVELSLGVVDESVLSLTESVTADLINVFYRKRMLSVSSAYSLTKALSRINVVVEAGEKGGGGGDTTKRGLFKDTAFFEAALMTNGNGEGSVTFKLPDNLTTWQALAIGVSDDTKKELTLVGSNKMNFLVTKDILVRPVLPRFFTSGDEMEISAIVHNYTVETQSTKVTLEAPELTLLDGGEKSINIASQGSEKVSWKVKVNNSEASKLSFTAIANGGEKGDSIEQVLPVKQPSLPTNVATSRVVAGDAVEIDKLWLPANLDLNSGKLTIKVSATLAGAINDGLKYLVSYPYGCTEQLASAILPNVVLKKLVNLGKFKTAEIDEKELDKNVEAGLQQLYLNQKPSGGFGLWQSSNENAYLSAYVLYTMYQAKTVGYAVDDKVINSTTNYLNTYIKTHGLDDKGFEWYGDNREMQQRNTANARAYMLFVLSEVGKGDLGLTKNLYQVKDRLSLISKAYLMMTLKNLDKESKDQSITAQIASLKDELQSQAKQTPRGVNFEEDKPDYSLFDTNTRSTAVVMQALNRQDKNNILIPKILQALLQERKGGHFNTTQDTAISLLALIEYFESSGELNPNFEAQVNINGERTMQEPFKSDNLFESIVKEIELNKLLPNNLDNEIAVQRTGTGKMYVD